MSTRAEEELAMLRTRWPELELAEPGAWVRLPARSLPSGIWDHTTVELAMQIPAELPGQAPYGFYVRPGLRHVDGRLPSNYTFPSMEPPFPGGPWGKFSWAPIAWRPSADPASGDNLVGFVMSFSDRLSEMA